MVTYRGYVPLTRKPVNQRWKARLIFYQLIACRTRVKLAHIVGNVGAYITNQIFKNKWL